MVRREYPRKAREARGPAYSVAEYRRMGERTCGGGVRVPGRGMVEVVEDHESLTLFEGDRIWAIARTGWG